MPYLSKQNIKEREIVNTIHFTKKCSICNRTFTISGRKAAKLFSLNLKLPSTCYHCHIEKKKFICNVCGEVFEMNNKQLRQALKLHGDEFYSFSACQIHNIVAVKSGKG